ncbi:MAG TPA: polysaccharide biosynthesis/export family protein, partial [Fimbriimonas sp.]|nr:polysaccharide biosynthesis/export family protein [Fimbriimonas sp.]
ARVGSKDLGPLKTIRLVLLTAIGVFLCSCSTEHRDESAYMPRVPPKQNKQRTSTDSLAIGDSLEVFVMEDASFNGVYKVREKGDIIFPKVGRVVVAGLTVDAAQQRIREALQNSQLQSATVIVDRINKTPHSLPFEEKPKILVFVTGKVNRPGQHVIAVENGTVYAYEAVLIAGGIAPFADEKHAYILRRGANGEREKITLDLRSIRQGRSSDRPLAEGDMICVPERHFSF